MGRGVFKQKEPVAELRSSLEIHTRYALHKIDEMRESVAAIDQTKQIPPPPASLPARADVSDEPEIDAREARPPAPSHATKFTFTVAALREMTGLENAALNRYAKGANVHTPARGQRNFKYTLVDVRAILNSILASTAEDELRAKCNAALQNLQEIAK